MDPDCLNMFNGQFVFAIWNNEKKEMFMARDEWVSVLFFTPGRERTLLSLVLRSRHFLNIRMSNQEIDPVPMSQVFTFWSTITPRTVFKNVFELTSWPLYDDL